MKISEVLQAAWDLISQPGAHTKRAFARNALLEPVHALHESATCWDSTGAIQKVLGELEGPSFDAAIRCLALGAMKVDRKLGSVEINDHGDAADLRAMWMFAIRTAENAEQQVINAFAAA